MVRISQNEKPSNSNFLLKLCTYALRTAIIAIGFGTLTGTVLANLEPQPSLETEAERVEKSAVLPINSTPVIDYRASLKQPIPELEQKLNKIAAEYPKLQAGIFIVDLDNQDYVSWNGETIFAAASTIKIPILVALLEDVDAGKIYLDQKLTLKEEDKTGGSGTIQYLKTGTELTILELATKMIVISDNTATNMLINQLGGMEVLNQRFRQWGLGVTVINNPLPDLEGTNITSPEDLVYLLNRVAQGELLSLRGRDRFFMIMTGTQNDNLLPQGLEKSAVIAHKTGDIGSVLADAGIIDIVSGKRYIMAVMVKRPHNDPQAHTLIRRLSEVAYQHLKWYDPRPILDPPAASQ